MKTKSESGKSGGEGEKSRSLYHDRLNDEGVPLEPIVPRPKSVRQFQLAHLAATLAKDGDAALSPSDLAGKAIQIWNAAGSALHVEAQAEVVVKGLLFLSHEDWQAHCKALVASLDDLEGAQPGQNSAESVRKSHEAAKVKAAAAVNRVWKTGPPKSAVLRALFHGKAETDDTRQAKFVKLLTHAKELIETGDSLPFGTHDADPVNAALLHAWEPLGVWEKKSFAHAVAQAKTLIEKPDSTSLASVVPFYPCVARWLAVMRQDQLSQAKKRT